jgi:hypothetical protein
MFVRVDLKDGREMLINLSAIVHIEKRPPLWLVTMKAHRLARVWRWFRSPMASESVVLSLDADEVDPILEAIEVDRFNPGS